MNTIKRYCRVTTRNNPVMINPMITRFTQVNRSLTFSQIAACFKAGAIVDAIDNKGNVIERLNFLNYKNVTTPTIEPTTVNVVKKETVEEKKVEDDTVSTTDNENDDAQVDPYDDYKSPMESAE